MEKEDAKSEEERWEKNPSWKTVHFCWKVTEDPELHACMNDWDLCTRALTLQEKNQILFREPSVVTCPLDAEWTLTGDVFFGGQTTTIMECMKQIYAFYQEYVTTEDGPTQRIRLLQRNLKGVLMYDGFRLHPMMSLQPSVYRNHYLFSILEHCDANKL